jgi:non-ribosomal peptide synthetase-like protein
VWWLLGIVFFSAQIGVAMLWLMLTIDVTHPVNAFVYTLMIWVIGGIIVVTIPKIAVRPLKAGRQYRLYGIYYWLFNVVKRTSNSPFFGDLFGDSSAIVPYLRAIGVKFPNPVQTGSNFGTGQKQHIPTMCTVGSGTVVSDGFTMNNADYTTHGFQVREVVVGARSFIGNGVMYPPDAAVGDDVLLATKVMIPTDGPVRSGVGLLGSPAFEIPRTVARDKKFEHLQQGDALREGLKGKNRHNLGTALIFLGVHYVSGYVGVASLLTLIKVGPVGVIASAVITIAFRLLFESLVDAAVRGFKPLQPLYCSMYDVRHWRHERYWKVSAPSVIMLFNGTPFKSLAWRTLGVKGGKMLFDDGVGIPERTMASIGDHVTLGSHSTLHGHSLEDGVFKTDWVRVGSYASIGPGACLQYDSEVGDGVVISTDAYFMSGERAEAGTVWEGNPCVLIGRTPAAASADGATASLATPTPASASGARP